jgi:hypothetical protein
MLGVDVPVFMFPLIGILGIPLATLVALKLVQIFFSIRHFFTVWVTATYIMLVIHATGLAVMLSRLNSSD